MPLPSCVRPRAFWTRWKRSNRRGISSAGMPVPVSLTQSTALAPSRRSATAISPSNVYLKALDSRLRTIFSHMSRSTNTGAESGGQSSTRRIPAASTAARKTLASSAVKAARSVGWYRARTRPASMREKSSRVLTSLRRRRPLRLTTSSSCLTAGGSSQEPRPSRSSTGPSISVSGVRNSWLTLEKNTVLARSIAASASARLRSSS